LQPIPKFQLVKVLTNLREVRGESAAHRGTPIARLARRDVASVCALDDRHSNEGAPLGP
jgi:hypothetical protein